MKEMSAKKIVLGCIAIAASLFTLLALFYPLMSEAEGDLTGFGMLWLMTGSESWMPICGIITILQMFASVTLLIVTITGTLAFTARKARAAALAAIIVCLVFNFVYAAEGIILAVVNNVTTLSYLALIINALFTTAYFVCSRAMTEKPFAQFDAQSFMTEEDRVIDYIGKYKKLLDDGAITQEEYDRKKQGLLK